jgi:hypothetical protein
MPVLKPMGAFSIAYEPITSTYPIRDLHFRFAIDWDSTFGIALYSNKSFISKPPEPGVYLFRLEGRSGLFLLDASGEPAREDGMPIVADTNVKIAAVASLMQAKKNFAKPFTVLLGAGASISSGVIPTETMIGEIVDNYGSAVTGSDLHDRFDKLWSHSSEENRNIFLKKYLDRQPSPGYSHLVELMRQGFIGTVITFNFDNLVEAALMNAGLRESFDYKVIVRGDYKDDRVVSMMDDPEPAIKILKLHGSLRGGNTFLFSEDEMSEYPEEIHELVRHLTSSDIILCGYGFADMCVVRAFSVTGESIYCVNPAGRPALLKGPMIRRHSEDNVIDSDDGKFDAFFEQLRTAVLRPGAAPAPKPTFNPFKFFDSFEPGDKSWLFGRRSLTRKLLALIPDSQAPVPAKAFAPVVPVIGAAKVGKTSFVRAGLMPYLDPAVYFPVYVRCTRDLEQSLPDTLQQRWGVTAVPGDIKATVQNLAASQPARHIVLILDQFERVVSRFQAAGQELNSVVKNLGGTGCNNLTVILVGEIDSQARIILCLNDLDIKYLYVKPIEARAVGRIVRLLAKKANAQFDPEVIQDLQTRYQESRGDESKTPFTLAHVQAICNLLIENAITGQGLLDRQALNGIIREHLDSLNRAINQFDILSFVEDLPLEEQRALLCRILRIVAEPGRTKIADYLKANVAELVRPRRPPAPPPGVRSVTRAGP